jgi:hypothetical protein
MKKIIAAAIAFGLLGMGVANAAMHHRHKVCSVHHHHRVCHWR